MKTGRKCEQGKECGVRMRGVRRERWVNGEESRLEGLFSVVQVGEVN